MSDTEGIQRALGRIEGKIDHLASTNAEIKAEQKSLRDDHKKLNAKVNYILGGLAVISSILTFFKAQITQILFS